MGEETKNTPVTTSPQTSKEKKIILYDFKRPDKFSKEQIRTIAIAHETFARHSNTAFSTMLRTECKVHVASVDQMTYEEFIRSVPNPCATWMIHPDPLKGPALMEIDPHIVFAIVERLYGGKAGETPFTRELTAIEERPLSEVARRLMNNLGEGWSSIIEMKPRLGSYQSIPLFQQIVAPREMIVLAAIETKIGQAEGMINLCYPYITIEPILSRLSAQYLYSSRRKGPAFGEMPAESIRSLPVDAMIFYEAGSLTLREIANLHKGSLVPLPDYQMGKSFIEAGGERVIELASSRPRSKVNRGRFSQETVSRAPIKSEIGEETEIAKLLVGYSRADREKMELKEAISSPISKIGSQLHDALGMMRERLDELGKKQDEIVDHLYFSTDQETTSISNVRDSYRPFGYVVADQAGSFLNLIRKEHPQTIALVLSYLEITAASRVLDQLPTEMQPDIVRRITTLERVAPTVVQDLDEIVREQVKAMGAAELYAPGGYESTVEILNLSARATEKNVIEELERRDPDLAEEIKKRMFVFEDCMLLDRKALAKIVDHIADKDLVLSLKATDEQVRDHFWKSMEAERIDSIKEQIAQIGRIRLKDAEAAQQRVITVIRKLESEGEIIVARTDETVV